MSVGLCDEHQEVEQLQPLAVVHVLGNLLAALADGFLECIGIPGILSFLLVEQLSQNFLALDGPFVAEVCAQELSYKFHLGVHNLSVCPYDIRCQHQQREDERVALPLVLPLLVLLIALLLILAVLVVVGARVLLIAMGLLVIVLPLPRFGRVDSVGHRIE